MAAVAEILRLQPLNLTGLGDALDALALPSR